MKTIGAVILLALVGGAGLLNAHRTSAGSHVRVDVTLQDYRVILVRRNLPVGTRITFVITNRGRHMHEFVLEPAHAFDKALRFAGSTDEADEINPGTTRTVTWVIPRQGTYKLACHIDHHYQKGMRTYVTAKQD